jgi:hypothetical protein
VKSLKEDQMLSNNNKTNTTKCKTVDWNSIQVNQVNEFDYLPLIANLLQEIEKMQMILLATGL